MPTPRWVAWREETRTRADGSEYRAKIPYDPNRRDRARIPTEPSTWNTRAKAERRWQQLRESDDDIGGVGIVLGEIDDGTLLMGIDLDDCFKADGDIEPWAVEIIDCFDTYAEVSPSGRGVKLFFRIARRDAAAAKQLLDGKTRKAFGAGKHREIAVDRARFYAVTDDPLTDVPTSLRIVKIDTLRWLIDDAGPRFLDLHGIRGGDERPRGETWTLPKSLQQILHHTTAAGYNTRNGLLFAFLLVAIKQKVSDETIISACLDPAFRGCAIYEHCRENGGRAYVERQIARARTKPGTRDNDNEETATLDVVRVSEVEMKPVRWVWPRRLARGKVTIFSGLPFLGKSLISIDTTARITRGLEYPDGGRAEIGNVVLLSAEDAVDDTIKPRLVAAGADTTRVTVVKMVKEPNEARRLFRLQTDLEMLHAKIAEIGDVALVVIDPISVYMGEKEGNSITTFRPVLSQLAEFAERADVAVLIIHHPPKSVSTAMNAYSGSLAFIAAPRFGFLVVKEAESERRLLLSVGSNVGQMPEGLGFYVVEDSVQLTRNTERGVRRVGDIKTGRIEWDATPVTMSANEALRETQGEERDRHAKLTEAIEFLREAVADGEREVNELLDAAQARGISERTLKRAKERLKLDAHKTGFDDRWVWRKAQREQP